MKEGNCSSGRIEKKPMVIKEATGQLPHPVAVLSTYLIPERFSVGDEMAE